jgi:hypothetical protein
VINIEFAYVRINSWADKNLFLSYPIQYPPNYYSTIYLLLRFARRDHANNPIRESTIPNPGDAGVAVAAGVTGVAMAVTVVTAGDGVKVAVDVGVNVAIAITVGFAFGGAPIAIRAALGLARWLGWF